MPEPLSILIATTNKGKLTEIQALFDEYARRPFRLVTPDAVGIRLDVSETGQTYAENAAIKARAFARAAGLPGLADDSGLEVDVLDGRPGLYSARYSGLRPAAPNGVKLTDADRRAALLEELAAYPRPWTARFRCAAALVLPDDMLHVLEGACEGEIIPEERGTGGFGYDPIFLVREEGLTDVTMAELTLAQKNRVSHRARAVRQAILLLEKGTTPAPSGKRSGRWGS